MRTSVAVHAIVATKIDKLSRAERLRATRALEAVFEDSVLPVSAVTGEGLDELWTLIDRLLNNHPPRSNRLPKATAPPPATARRHPFRRRKS
jgi:50S ribosomal subunit-associated GTPase HflX